jgi:hypothetical protein
MILLQLVKSSKVFYGLIGAYYYYSKKSVWLISLLFLGSRVYITSLVDKY